MLQDIRVLRGVLQCNRGKGGPWRRRRRRQRRRALLCLFGGTFGQKVIFTSTTIALISFSRPAVEAVAFLFPFRVFILLPLTLVRPGARRIPTASGRFALLMISNPCFIGQIVRWIPRQILNHRKDILLSRRGLGE